MRTDRFVLGFHEIDRTQIAIVGGKGASLGELSRIDGIRVPTGFCVTTDAFRRVLENGTSIDGLLAQLSQLTEDDHESIRVLSDELRRTVEEIAIPDDIASTITRSLAQFGSDGAYAVRSSATAEDSPTTSFAGQHDTYLNVSGPKAILEHVRRCWASLYTERAVTYRLRNEMDHRRVYMAVVVQRMVSPLASGILFTADPVTGNRKITSVEASVGLGEALVSGLVNPDVLKVRDDAVVGRTIATDRQQAVLTDEQVVELARLGRKIEAHFVAPQDIEWCLDDDGFLIVQSRPITTLFPTPVAPDEGNHVYLSTGHQQMMTDARTPLGIAIWQMTAAVPMYEAGGRLYVDVSRQLSSAGGRAGLMALAGRSDTLTGDALRTIIDRDFIPLQPEAAVGQAPPRAVPPPLETEPAVVAELVANGQASNAKLKEEIQSKAGSALLEFIAADVKELRRILSDPRSYQAIMAGTEATWWLNDHIERWLGEKNVADTLSQSAPNNITSEMGLELLHVADVIRQHPSVVGFLQQVGDDEHFLNELPQLAGGDEARDAIQAWLDKHGMRGVGEIDIARPRWIERPSMLVPLILGNVRNFEPGAGELRFSQGLRAAKDRETAVLQRLRELPEGEEKARETKAMIERLRTFVGYREYPKYFIIERHFAYKRALMTEADRLVQARVIRDPADIFFLTFQELQDVVRTKVVDERLIAERKEAFKRYQALTPPRVLTSEGESVAGAYRRDDFPPGALVGLAVSAGTVEGRARVLFDLAGVDLEPGDILVTPYTDPSWTPAFVSIKGLVTEVGGQMTHGSVIAREYGLPAVVSVEGATRLIRNGQMIRVNGTNGYVELLA